MPVSRIATRRHILPAPTLRNLMSVNVEGAFMVAQEAARRMIRDGRGGSIINMSSVLSEMPMRQVAAYSTVEGSCQPDDAMPGAGMGKAQDQGQRDPAWMVRNRSDGAFLKGPGAKIMADQNPTGRLGEAHDLDGACCCSPQKRAYMTGSTITVDGGHSIGR
jgi:2-deoxy-D-gluconate 3-dehydrogenase